MERWGFWAALSDVFPETAEQRCWVRKTANILDALAKRLHRQAKAVLHEIYQAETRHDAEAGIDDFVRVFGAKYPKAVDKLTRDREVLLTFYDFPARRLTTPSTGFGDISACSASGFSTRRLAGQGVRSKHRPHRPTRRGRTLVAGHRDPGAPRHRRLKRTTEGLNLLVKKVKRCGHGFNRFAHYRLRVLLHRGGIAWQTPSPPTLRPRAPHPNA